MSSKFKCKNVTILGVTGSVGQNTASVILRNADHFDVDCVTAHSNVGQLAEDAKRLNARHAVIADEQYLNELSSLLSGSGISCSAGDSEISSCVEGADIVMAAIVGFAGISPILRALERGIDVAIANKEPLVAAGDLIMRTARANNAKILPVDSEHNAIFQVFENHNKSALDKIILTASGGPFLKFTPEQLHTVTPEQAIKHPNWDMGAKISVDSATMMNKALEIIEAHYLFDVPAEQIDVLIHPQSIIHSMVSYQDGSTLAQMGASDMCTPIASALAYPSRLEEGGGRIDFSNLSDLTFETPDFEQFPALRYAYECLKLGQGACVALNAANEVAVNAFLQGRIRFNDILKCVGFAVDTYYKENIAFEFNTVHDIEAFDRFTRSAVEDHIINGLQD